MKSVILRSVLASLTLLASSLLPVAHASPVTIGDPSFEDNSFNAVDWTNSIGPEWTGTGGQNHPNAFEEYATTLPAADGTDHLGMVLGYDVWQDLGATYQPSTRYTLTIAAGNRPGSTNAGNLTQYLLADSNGVVYATGEYDAYANQPAGTFVDAPPLVFDTPDNPAAIGKTVRVLLRARGANRSHFDHIRLDATSLIPPGAATVENTPATAVTASSAELNGQVSTLGVGAPSITLFWGTGNGGMLPANWQNSQTLGGTHTGAFTLPVSSLPPASTVFFTTRATNAAGESWAPAVESFETLPLPPGVANGAVTDIKATSAKVSAQITSTGGEAPTVTIYYGPADGGTNPAGWQASVTPGATSDAITAPLSGLSHATPYYFRAFAQNSGGSAWAPATTSFATLSATPAQIINQPATGITGTTATLQGDVIDTGNDAPALTFFYGTSDGGTNPAAWEHSAPAGTDSGEFGHFVSNLTPNTPYFFRCRAVNAGGTSWAPDSLSFSTSSLVSSVPVISEIHYHPADDPTQGPLPLEFIELHNPGDTSVDLSGWRIANAVTFTFPAGTTLAGGAYLAVAQNPAALLTQYGAAALGPWTGRLSSTGETIQLLNAASVEIDRVSYKSGFPWPTAADGAGPSMELVHPGLDNDLGGSWRSSGTAGSPAATYIAASSSGWKYKKGTAEATSPVDAWRDVNFDDSSWPGGQAPIGYGTTVACNTPLSDMKGSYSTVYARRSFTIASGNVPETLNLRVRYDDGCIVWINGNEVFRANMPATNEVAYNTFSTGTVTTSTWTTLSLNETDSYLHGGSNVICIQGANVTLNGSSDFNFDAELTYAGTGASSVPTPRAANAARLASNLVPPQIRQVSHSPNTPAAGAPVTISARITDPDGVGPVSLLYQTVDPGAYVPLKTVNATTKAQEANAAYSANWTTVPMFDDGTNGDAVAGDSNFTAILPHTLQTHRRLVRYKITLADTLGNTLSVPYADDEQPNFAYFVYDGVPSWTGAFRPSSFNGFPATSPVTYPAGTVGSLPPYHLIATAADVANSQYNGNYNGVRFRGTLVYDGVVYDHIEFKNRGIGSTYQSGKNKWNIFFNRARDLAPRDNWGKKYGETWNNLILNANASPWAPVNRGSAGIEEAASARIYELAGNTNFRTHYVHFRVIDDAAESGATQYDGDLWGLYLAVEPTEGNFLDERGLADGNIYSIEGNGGDKKHQGEGQPVDSSDWTSFSNNLAASGQTEAWYRANMDLDKLYTFMAINRLIGNVDVRPGDNYRYYHRTSDNRWEILAYDLDMQFIAAHHWGGTMDGVVVAGQPHSIRAVMRHPNLARKYRNRCRELMDLLASDGAADGGQIGQLLQEYAAMVHPAGESATWAWLDASLWNLNPKTKDWSGGITGQYSHTGNFFRALFYDSRGDAGGTVRTASWVRTLYDPDGDGFADFPARVKWFVDFSTNTYPAGAATWVRKATNTAGGGNDPDTNRQKGYGYKYLEWESLYGGYADANNEPTTPPNTDFPDTPTLAASGDPSFPVSDLSFSSSAFADPQGAGTFAAWQWRIAEISAPGISGHDDSKPWKYEVQTLAQSSELSTPPGAFTIPLGIAEAGRTYRVRVRHKDSSGNWSHWSAPAQFAATAPPLDLVHYWNFNTPAALLVPTRTSGGGAITPVLTGASAVLADSGQSFAAENARDGDPAGTHLRFNNPIGSTLDIAIPSSGYENLIVQYETRRSGQGAGTQSVSYTLDGTTYTPFATFTILDDDPEVKILDFRAIPGANDNPDFALRVAFSQGSGGIAGNNRFDNLTVEGDALPAGYDTWKLAHFSAADLADPTVSGPHANPSGDGVENLIRYAHGAGPHDPVLHLLPVVGTSGPARVFKFRYDATKTDLRWRVRASNDLSDWSGVLFDSATSPIPPLEDGWLSVEIPDSLDNSPTPDPKIFMRLEVVQAD